MEHIVLRNKNSASRFTVKVLLCETKLSKDCLFNLTKVVELLVSPSCIQ